MSAPNWRTERKRISDLIPWPGNPRIGTTAGHKHLTNSIKKYGLCQDIVCNDDLVIIGGHQRVFAMKAAGVIECDVKLPDRHLSEREVKELNIRLNRNIAGEWDMERLANEWDTEDLKEWGFNDKDFATFGGSEPEEECESCPTCGKKMKGKK